MKKLKELNNSRVAQFQIVDEWSHQYVETLDRDDAIRKYGNCEVYGSYTSGCVKDKGFVTDIWLWLPGQHVYDEKGHRVTIMERK